MSDLSTLNALFPGARPNFAASLVSAAGSDAITERLAPPSGANASVTLAQLTGAGIVRSLYVATNSGGLGQDGRLRVTVDGESTPCIDVDIGTLALAFWQQNRPAFGGNASDLSGGVSASTDNWSSDLSGNTMPDFLVAFNLRFPMPFSNGIKIEIFRPAGIDTGNGVDAASPSRQIYSAIEISRETPPPAIRLRAAVNSFRGGGIGGGSAANDGLGLHLPVNTDADVFLLTPGKPGWLVWHGYCGLPWTLAGPAVSAANGRTWIERNPALIVDGEATPSWQWSGHEELSHAGWTWAHLDQQSRRVSALTLGNRNDGVLTGSGGGTYGHFNACIDFLASVHGIRFGSSLRMRLLNDTNCTVDALMTTGSLYYLSL